MLGVLHDARIHDEGAADDQGGMLGAEPAPLRGHRPVTACQACRCRAAGIDPVWCPAWRL